MKVTSTALAILSAASATYAFVPRPLTPVLKNANARSTQQLYALGVKEKEETTTATTGSTVNGSVEQADSTDPDAEGLPWWWEYLFKLQTSSTSTSTAGYRLPIAHLLTACQRSSYQHQH